MKKYLTLSLMIVLGAVTAACQPDDKIIVDSSNIAVPADTQAKYSQDKIGNIIAESAAHRGWSVNKTGTVIKAKAAKKEKQVAIIINYSKSSYSIKPDPAVNSDIGLYNRYVANLRKDIDKRLSVAAYK